jgi:hypothetical protein
LFQKEYLGTNILDTLNFIAMEDETLPLVSWLLLDDLEEISTNGKGKQLEGDLQINPLLLRYLRARFTHISEKLE